MKITFRQIDAFRTVVSTGTVTETAQVLGISQPAVSRLISDFESEVGFKLFTRSGRNLKPTLEARLLVDEVRRALSGLERIKDAADAIRRFQHAQLRLITSPAFGSMLAPRLIRQFAERRPEAMISLEIQSTDDTVEWMVVQNHDFGIAAPTGRNPAILNRPLIKREAVCVVPSGHHLASANKLSPKDLEGESFISHLADSTFKFQVDEVFREAGVERRLQYEARTTDAVCRLVSENLGVSIVGSADGIVDGDQNLVAIPFAPAIGFAASLIWSRQHTMSAVAQDFLRMVETEFSD